MEEMRESDFNFISRKAERGLNTGKINNRTVKKMGQEY